MDVRSRISAWSRCRVERTRVDEAHSGRSIITYRIMNVIVTGQTVPRRYSSPIAYILSFGAPPPSYYVATIIHDNQELLSKLQ